MLSHLNGNLGVVNNILTSYANAVSDSDKLSLAGAVNYLSLSNTTTAWVGSGASLDSTGVAPGSAWSVTRFDGQVTAFDPGVSVNANTDTQTVNVAGNSSPITFGGSGGAGSAVGGSLELFKSSTSTIAGIADGATVSSKTKIIVDAATHDIMFSVAPSSGAHRASWRSPASRDRLHHQRPTPRSATPRSSARQKSIFRRRRACR